MINIISDVAGQFDALMALVKKMPDAPFLFLGDLNDRGPKSKEVIEWVMNNPNANCLQSNHGDMFVDWYRGTKRYEKGIFGANGGRATIESYGLSVGMYDRLLERQITHDRAKALIPEEHIKWLADLPLFFMKDGLFVSHAAWAANYSIDHAIHVTTQELKNGGDYDMGGSLIWTRDFPEEREGLVQIMGHNSSWGLKYFGPVNKPWAICIDQSRRGILTGIHYPTLEIFEEKFA